MRNKAFSLTSRIINVLDDHTNASHEIKNIFQFIENTALQNTTSYAFHRGKQQLCIHRDFRQ